MTPPSPLQWVTLLYQGVTPPAGFVEFRFLKSGSRAWMPWPTFEGHPEEFHVSGVPKGQEAYWGVSLRKDSTDGKAANCHPTHLVWTDVDLVDHPDITGGQSKDGLLEASPEELAGYKDELLRHVLARCEEHGLPPRAIVDSGHGLQVYWARRARSNFDDTEAYNRALMLAFGGDAKSVDVARILRLPGTQNLKNKARPLPVQVVWEDANAWVERDALDNLPKAEQPRPAPVSQPSEKVSQPAELTGNAQERYAQAAFQKELEELRATGEGGRNHALNKAAFSAGQFIGAGVLDEVTARHELADTAQAIGLEPGEIRDTIHSGISDGKAEPRDMSRVGQKPERKPAAQGTIGKNAEGQGVTAEAALPDTLAPQMPASGVYVEHGCYYIDRPVKKNGEVVDWRPEQLTNFVWEPSLYLRYPDGTFGERGTLIVRGASGREMQIEARSWNSRRDLLETIGGYGARCITTNSSDVAKIADYVAATYPALPSAQGVKSYGLHRWEGEWVEVFEDATVSSSETPPLFYSGTPVDPGSRSYRAPRPAAEEQVNEARRGVLKLPQLVTPAVAYALLGYGAAAAFSPRITPHLGNRLPFVYVAGERESGKTSGAQIALELVTGYSARLTKASGMTPYQYDIAHSGANNLLALLDEYRPGEIDDGQLRKHHDLGTKWRGTGMGSKDLAYELNAPLIVLGEGFTDDAATKSRGVLYLTRKGDRGGVDVYSEVLKLPLWAYAGHLHRLAREMTDEAHESRMVRAAEMAEAAIGGAANPRLRYALTYIAYGLLVLQEDTGVLPDQAILDTLREGAHNTLEGGEEGVTNLELFLEQLCFALAKVPNPEAYVAPSAATGTLILRPRMCVDLVKERYREQAAIANAKLFNQYAEQADFFDKGEVHKSVSADSVRGRRIRLDDIPARCDAGFLVDLDHRLRPQEGGYATRFD